MPDRNRHDQPIGHPVADWTPPVTPSATPLAGHWCRLEPLSMIQHAQALYAGIVADDDPASWTYLGYGPFASASAYREWVAHAEQDANILFYAVIDLADNNPVGVASYLRIEPTAGTLEIGHLYFTHRLRRTAVATEAIALLLQHAFALGYRRCEWKCDALNSPSRRAAERLGFTFEGIFRQATVTKSRNRDTAWYAIIDRDWPAIEQAFAAWLSADNFDAEGRQKKRLGEYRLAE